MAQNHFTSVNDVHSRLNAARVQRVVAPATVAAAQEAVAAVHEAGASLSIAGGRHAMGGQQFLSGGVLVDTRQLNRITGFDAERGLLNVEAGIFWSDLVAGLQEAQRDEPRRWSVVQKQTGADRLSIGGALAANGHGRGLTYRPMVQDVASFELIDPNGNLLQCSRNENPELFKLAIGGYGLFGVIAAVSLRLMPALQMQRVVEITTVDRLPARFAERIADGFTYGDFQYRTDENSSGFLRDGVLSCYRPVQDGSQYTPSAPLRLLTEDDWRRLLYWSHADKARAFDEYAAFYRSTDGQLYDSDTFQLSLYIDDYHRELDQRLGADCAGSETITELYVPLERLPDFMDAAGQELRQRGANVIYGTIRLIEQDDETFLNWARQRYACIVFNLHVDHTEAGIAQVGDALRALIDIAATRDGSYFLTYNRFATRKQLARCYPQFAEFRERKRRFDPDGVFASDWYRNYEEPA